MSAVLVSGHDAAKQKGSRRDWGSQIWLANRNVSGSSLALARMVLQPGRSGEAHRHPNADEVLYLIKGQIAVQAGNERFLLQPTDALTIPGDLSHRIENIGNEDAEIILTYSTGNREYVAE